MNDDLKYVLGCLLVFAVGILGAAFIISLGIGGDA